MSSSLQTLFDYFGKEKFELSMETWPMHVSRLRIGMRG